MGLPDPAASRRLAHHLRYWVLLPTGLLLLGAVVVYIRIQRKYEAHVADLSKPGVVLKIPGQSYSGPLPQLTDDEVALQESLRQDVKTLASDIGERCTPKKYDKLMEAKAWIEKSLSDAGYHVTAQSYDVKGRTCFNLEAEILGSDLPAEIVVVGAHYDSVVGAPGANDNGSGVVGLLALARHFSGKQTPRTLRFVAFTNEEPPYFQTDLMGSLVYARRCSERKENIVAMLSLETIGYFTDAPDSQKYPGPLGMLYPSTGNFIGFIGNVASGPLVTRATTVFRAHAKFPSEGAALPGEMVGVGWSDHWSFWEAGYPALMVTDTAPFRYPYYHTAKDAPDRIDYGQMARVVAGLRFVVEDLVQAEKK